MAWQYKTMLSLLALTSSFAPSTDAKLKQTEKILFKECDGNVDGSEDNSIYGSNNFMAEDIHREKNISISDYEGKVLLVVNVASF